MQTILLVPVLPHGVLQLGSLEEVQSFFSLFASAVVVAFYFMQFIFCVKF